MVQEGEGDKRRGVESFKVHMWNPSSEMLLNAQDCLMQLVGLFEFLCYSVVQYCVCCLVTKEMKLVPNVGSDRAWVWSTHADFADEEVKHEQLAIRFANAESE